MNSQLLIMYLCIVSFIGLAAIWWATSTLFKIKTSRSKRIRNLETLDSIETSSPYAKGKTADIDVAVENIESRFSIIGKIVVFLILAVWAVALAFPFLELIPTALVSILITVSGVVIGIAARPLIENIIAGMVISFSRAIRVGDTVMIDGNYGTVEDISLNHTIVKLWNWKRLIIPSSKMLSKEIINLSYHDSYIWVHVTFYVSYDTSLEKVKKIAIESVQGSDNFSSSELPSFWVMEMEKDAYQCWVAGWTDTAIKAWNLASDTRTGIAMRFQSEGVRAHRFGVDVFPSLNQSLQVGCLRDQ